MNVHSQIQDKTILAFDSSGVTGSVAVSKNGKILTSFFSNTGYTHSKTLLPAIEKALENAGLLFDEIDALALTTGPGSFTGIKIGVSTAKGLAFAKNLPCYAVSTTAALAASAIGFDGTVCPVMDARREMFYNALYEQKTAENSGKIVKKTKDRQISAEELAKEIDGKNALIIGDGTALFSEYCEKNGIIIRKSAEILKFIHAENIIEAVNYGLFEESDPKTLSASYLRQPMVE